MSTTTPEEQETPIARAMREAETNVLNEPQAVVHEVEPESAAESEETVETPEEHDTQLDDIEMQVAAREWTVQGEIQQQRGRGAPIESLPWKRVYVQKPLSFGAMLQFTGLIGDRLSQAMAGPEGLSLDGIVSAADGGGGPISFLGRGDFDGVDSFIKGLAKLAAYVPDIVEDCQCIWLRIPFNERPIVKEIWSRSPEDGGLSLEEGEAMLETFLGQNYREVEDFFGERLPRLLKKFQTLRERAGRSPRSKRSKPTPAQDTPSQ